MTLNPSFHEAHYVLGLCLKDREELAEARAAFERASAIAPAFIPAREELAELHRLQQQTRAEIEQLDALYALDPDNPERLIAVGRAYLRAGNRDLAVMTLGRAAENFKEPPGVYAALGQVWLEAAEDGGDPSDLRKALEALEPVADASDGQQRDARYVRPRARAGGPACGGGDHVQGSVAALPHRSGGAAAFRLCRAAPGPSGRSSAGAGQILGSRR